MIQTHSEHRREGTCFGLYVLQPAHIQPGHRRRGRRGRVGRCSWPAWWPWREKVGGLLCGGNHRKTPSLLPGRAERPTGMARSPGRGRHTAPSRVVVHLHLRARRPSPSQPLVLDLHRPRGWHGDGVRPLHHGPERRPGKPNVGRALWDGRTVGRALSPDRHPRTRSASPWMHTPRQPRQGQCSSWPRLRSSSTKEPRLSTSGDDSGGRDANRVKSNRSYFSGSWQVS